MSNKRITTAEIVDDLKTCSDMDKASCLFCWRYSSGTHDAHCVGTLMIDAAERLERLQDTMNRLGEFGKLFANYNGCPRGPMGRMGGVSLIDEALSMPEIVDVDGGRWIPVQADVLHELCDLAYPCLISMKKQWRNKAMERLTTDNPQNNFETMLNMVYSKDGWGYIRHDEENMKITDFCLGMCRKYDGCAEFAKDYANRSDEEKDELLCDCVFESCPVPTVYAALSGFCHVRERLKMYEDAGIMPQIKDNE